MRRCARWLSLAVLISIAVAGCGTATSVTVTVSPATTTVLTSGVVQFTATVTGSTTTPTWAVNGTTGGSTTLGTITTAGLYTAPATVPLNTDKTVTVITVTGAIGSASGSATVTVNSGVRVTITPASFTIGTSEVFDFSATVTGVTDTTTGTNCGPSPSVPCNAVTWSIVGASTTTACVIATSTTGCIDPNTGIYTAPGTVPTTTVDVEAVSVFDPTETGDTTVTIVAATDPVPTSISPTAGAIGAPFEDINITGASFISTTNVFINHRQVPSQNILSESNGTSLRVRVPDSFLSVLPTSPAVTTTLVFTLARQGSAEQSCTSPASCQLILSPVRPALVGTTPDSIPQGSSGALSFSVDGGFFGTPTSPVVTAEFAGQSRFIQIGTDDRQLSVILNGSDVNAPGLFPIGIFNDVFGDTPGSPRAVANLAVQPKYSGTLSPTATLPVGTNPGSVAIDTGTGLAVVTNRGTSDVTLIDLTQPTPPVVGYLCTGTIGAVLSATESHACLASGPVGVAVDNLRHIALVANATTNNVAVIDLTARTVTALVPSLLNGAVFPAVPFTPAAVGINPVSGRAILVYSSTNSASILDVTQSPPVIIGSVAISTGAGPRVAVSPSLNWAIVTPGGAGSLSIVDLSQRTVNSIVSASRTAGTVTVTTSATHTLQLGESVLIQGLADTTFNGVYTVASVLSNTSFTYTQPTSSSLPNGSTTGTSALAVYAVPVATLGVNGTMAGVGVNDETHKAILADPNSVAAVQTFSVLDQSSGTLALPANVPGVGNVGAAFNPLANIAVVVNEFNRQAFIVDPKAPAVLSTIAVGATPVDVAIDPATNTAIVVNQGDNTVSIIPLGTLRSPQILQTSISPGPSFPGLSVLVGSTLTTAAQPVDQTLSIVGQGFTAGSVARLDGAPLATTFVSDRKITATVPQAMQTTPRRFALDVVNSGAVSNAASLTVIFSVDLRSSSCAAPAPQGVAVDPQDNVAAVTEPGCTNGSVALINLPGNAAPIGTGPTVLVGNSPRGVGIFAQTKQAVVANQGGNNASIIDLIGGSVTSTVNTDSGPSGVAIDSGTGNALVTASTSNTLDVFSIASPPASPTSIGVQLGPVAVAVDPAREFAVIANGSSNTATLVDLNTSGVLAEISGFAFPSAVAFDPISSDFLVASSLSNQVQVIDPVLQSITGIRVGVNPTSIAYNAATSTLATTNSLSHTMTIVDFLDRSVRAVFPVTPSNAYAVDIHSFLNLAVVADSGNNRVLLIPLPR